ncbi:MAG: FemAB family XrtA/PEP-CTERM system-associated protein [Candidatus Desantisbacteria bacterium]
MLRIYELTVADEIYWDEYVTNSLIATPYHLSGWKRVVEKSFGHKPYYILAKNEGKIVGVLPCFLIKYPMTGCSLISLPFTGYAGVLADNPEVEQELLSEIKRITNTLNANYLELRSLTLNNEKELYLKDIYVTFFMDMEINLESNWDMIPSKGRNMIRKALKLNLTTDINRDYLKDFYSLFVRRMRDLGTPVYSLNFFQNIMKEWKTATIMAIKNQDRVIAAGLLIPFKDTLYNPWTASNKDFLDAAPNNLFYWECIRYCHENGLAHFDIGRSIWHSSTFNFKKNIGAVPKQLYYQYYLNKAKDMPGIDVNNPRYRMCIKMWQKLPVWLTKMIGPGIIRYIP